MSAKRGRMAIDFHVRRDDLHNRRFAPAPEPPDIEVGDGDALLHVDRFAFTANNVTYGAMGDALRYWEFFPAPGGWGRIPAWGFGTVVRSGVPEIAEGTRYYGYFPMSTYVVMRPGRVLATTFSDVAAHRAALHPLYNQYTLTPPATELEDAMQLLLRPLFITSFILDDYLAENESFGAKRVIVSSASSKTAYGMAFLIALRHRAEAAGGEIVGLTSLRNAGFVRELGFYDHVITYDEIATLADDAPAVYIDFAADAGLRRAIHARLGERLMYSGSVGLTHYDATADGSETAPLAGPQPEPFFAPAQIKKRIGDWGPAGFTERFDAAWNTFVGAIEARGSSWLAVTYGSGPDDLERVYAEALAGTLRPERGNVLSL